MTSDRGHGTGDGGHYFLIKFFSSQIILVLVLLSAHVERFSVSRMRNCLLFFKWWGGPGEGVFKSRRQFPNQNKDCYSGFVSASSNGKLLAVLEPLVASIKRAMS